MAAARLPHLALTAAEPRAPALWRAVVERVADHPTSAVRELRLRAVAPWPEEDDELAAAAADSASLLLPSPPRPSPPPFTYRAGQWVDFHIPGVPTVGGYSFLCAPSAAPALLRDAPALPSFDLAVKASRHAPAAWVHSAACAPGATVGVRVGGGFNLELLRQRQQQPSAGTPAASTAAAAPSPPPPPRSLLFVAGGVGINPLWAMLVEAAAHLASIDAAGASSSGGGGGGAGGTPPSALPLAAGTRLALLWSVRTPAEAQFLLPRLAELARALHSSSRSGSGSGSSSGSHPLLTMTLVTTRAGGDAGDAAAVAAAHGMGAASGRITATLLADTLRRLRAADGDGSNGAPAGGTVAFVCGPPGMTDDVTRTLAAGGDFAGPGVDIHSEKWW